MKQCDLCGVTDRDVLTRLAWFTDDVVGRVKAVDRCRDDVACRSRLEADGEEWPLVDRTETYGLRWRDMA